MSSIVQKTHALNWQNIADDLHDKGYALIPSFLSSEHCASLIGQFDNPQEYRKTVVMERYRFGLGAYKYWNYPLPPLVQGLREHLYPHLVPIANLWMKLLRIDKKFPDTYMDLQTQCHAAGQTKPTPLILKYGEGGYNTLHQDLYGEVYFPIQAACFLSQPEQDYTGGEFVLTQQVPRAQSKAIVLKPQQGDMVLFTTNFRPVKGSRGYYRATMRHGVSELHNGERYTMGIIFHDAVS